MVTNLVEQRIETLERHVRSHFGERTGQMGVVQAPLRICPLGAHVDHQGGLVSGMAIDHSVLFAFRATQDDQVRVGSSNFEGQVCFPVDQPPPPGARKHWGDYLRGAAQALHARYPLRRGLEGWISGDLPIGGLSSSAAVGLAYLHALAWVNDLSLGIKDYIELDADVEHRYIGVQNGILDQTTILASRKDHLLLLDCQNVSWTAIPAPEHRAPFSIVVAYSGVDKSLANTDYNRRVDECREAASRLLALSGEASTGDALLRQVNEVTFDEHGKALPENLHRRALHYFSEQRRVREGAVAWEEGDWVHFGQLVRESGASSIHQYECGSPPLISLFSILNQCPGVYGARFSGAGFRGCCIGLATPDAGPEIRERVLDEYRRKHPELADLCQVHTCGSDDGVRLLCAPSC